MTKKMWHVKHVKAWEGDFEAETRQGAERAFWAAYSGHPDGGELLYDEGWNKTTAAVATDVHAKILFRMHQVLDGR